MGQMHDGFMMWFCGEAWAGSERGSANGAAPSGSLGCSSYSLCLCGNAFSRNEWLGYQVRSLGSVSVATEAELSDALGFAGHLPWFGQKVSGFVHVHSWVSCVLLQEPHPCIARAHPAPFQMDTTGKEGSCSSQSHSPLAGLGSSTAHESSLVLSTILQSKPNHETVLLLSDRVTSQKLCGGSTKSPVFSFAKLSQVIQSPERFFCQSEFAVIKLRCCEG